MRGCFKFVLAVVAGLVLGVGGLGGALWLWAGSNIFAPTATVLPPEWGTLREAGLSLKLVPAAVALKRGQEKDLEISLRPDEINHLLDQRLPPVFKQTDIAVDAGDTATIIRFSRQIKPHRFVNGEVHADISGSAGQFEVKVFQVKIGRKQLPHSMFYLVSRWMESALETQAPFKEQRFKLTGFRREGESFTVFIQTRKAEPGP